MSRLDSFIRRLQAQRACLDLAAAAIRDLPGPVLELGLGNGRTYDHLRELLPAREIFVFERQLAAHPACVPDPAHLILGDIRMHAAGGGRRLPGRAALAHSDIGTGDPRATRRSRPGSRQRLPALLAPGAWVIADQALTPPALAPLPLPDGMASGATSSTASVQ